MKKLAFLLAFLLFLTACGAKPPIGGSGAPGLSTSAAAQTTAPAAADVTELTLLVQYAPEEDVMAQINELLADRGLPVKLDVQTFTFKGGYMSDAYKTWLPNTDIAVFTDHAILAQMASLELLQDLSFMEDMYPMLWETVPDTAWETGLCDGLYAGYPLVSATDYDYWAQSVLIRSDIVEALGAEMPTSPEELLELCELARSKGYPCDLVTSAAPPYAFQRTYDEWPFYVDLDSLVYFDGERFTAYVDSPVFLQDMATLTPFGETGLLRLLTKAPDINAFAQEWDALAALYPMSNSVNCPYADDIEWIQFAPEKEYLSVKTNVSRWVGITSACEEPELAAALIDLIYTDLEVYDLFVHGIEGKHWEADEDGRLTQLASYPFINYFMSAIDPFRQRYLSADSAQRELLYADIDVGLRYYPIDAAVQQRIFSGWDFGNPKGGMIYVRAGLLPPETLTKVQEGLRKVGLDEIVAGYNAGLGE